MEATVRYVDNMTFIGQPTSGHAVVMDTSVANGGSDSAATPMEHLLIALGSCSGIDVVSILRKKRIAFDSFTVHVEGKRRDEHPCVFTDIKLDYVFRGNGLEDKRKHLEDAVRLSQEKYCSVAGMLKASVNLSWQVVIEPAA